MTEGDSRPADLMEIPDPPKLLRLGTLQRHLEAQGTSFATLLDEVRRDETERYLRDSDIPLGQLAGILGYSEQSVLSRSCQRWFGTSASAYRRSVRSQAAPPYPP